MDRPLAKPDFWSACRVRLRAPVRHPRIGILQPTVRRRVTPSSTLIENPQKIGEGGIRTPGTRNAHWFSKPAPSAARAPLLPFLAGRPDGLSRAAPATASWASPVSFRKGTGCPRTGSRDPVQPGVVRSATYRSGRYGIRPANAVNEHRWGFRTARVAQYSPSHPKGARRSGPSLAKRGALSLDLRRARIDHDSHREVLSQMAAHTACVLAHVVDRVGGQIESTRRGVL